VEPDNTAPPILPQGEGKGGDESENGVEIL